MTVDQGGSPPQTDPAMTLGDTLRSTRLEAGASIEQVEADLRIKSKYVEAMEYGDVSALPSRAYTDGFLRSYATYLGLDPADTVRRFAAENGLASAATQPLPVLPVPKSQDQSLGGFSSRSASRQNVTGTVGRAMAAVFPFVLFGGMAFGGYTGFVAARDAGLLPPQLGGIALDVGSEVPDSGQVAETPEPARTAVAEAPAEPDVPAQTEVADTAEVKPEPAKAAPEIDLAAVQRDTVGNEDATGRPDSLSYARSGSTPYWQAEPPEVEPADGPVADIEPTTAGVLRTDEADNPEAPTRWTAAPARETQPADATRIAAEARRALVGALAAEVDAVDDEAVLEGTAVAAAPTDDTVIALADGAEPVVTLETVPTEVIETVPVPGIGPIVTESPSLDLAPAVPAQPPRRFAIVAGADAWVQVTDALGTVTYTGILSAGESYTIPDQEGLRLQTGNAGGLYIEVDGQRFGPLGGSGAVMRNVALNPGAVRASFTLSQAAALTQ